MEKPVTEKKRKGNTVMSNEFLLTTKRVRYLLRKINCEQNLIDAYSYEGWKGQSLEKIRPEKELERAKSQILQCKLRIRDTLQHLDSLVSVGRLDGSLFDDDGQIDSNDIFCAKCGSSNDSMVDNDIILCDGNCDRGFHQKCLNPPLPTNEIPPDDEGWLCPACDCKVDCLDLINEFQESDLSIEDTWEKVFPEAAVVANGNKQIDDSNYPTDDSEDFDYNPDAPEVNADDQEEGSSSEESDSTSLSEEDIEPPSYNKFDDLGLPSDDSEDDNYDPECPDSDTNVQNGGSESNESDFSSDSDDFCVELSKSVNVNQSLPSSLSDYKQLDGSDEVRDAMQKISINKCFAFYPYVFEAYGKASSSSSEGGDLSDKATPKKAKNNANKKGSAKLLDAKIQCLHNKGTSSIKGEVMEDHMTEIDMTNVENSPDRTYLNPGEQYAGDENQATLFSRRKFSQKAYQKLQQIFKENQYPNHEMKANLAEELGVTVKRISKWFENARHSFRVFAKGSYPSGASATNSDKKHNRPGTCTPNKGSSQIESCKRNTKPIEENAKNTPANGRIGNRNTRSSKQNARNIPVRKSPKNLKEACGEASFSSSKVGDLSCKATLKKSVNGSNRKDSATNQRIPSIKGKVKDDDMIDIDMTKQHSGDQNRATFSSRKNFCQKENQKLQEIFNENQYPTSETKAVLAEELGVTVKRISKWFENARHTFRNSR
ncbi:homeobox protein HOX1A [Canna indica]|uniref:Homeobox protein HOX1A n=1 Tax=Canna indica TaxID=4628 RepID=A0AAQ3K0C1_9LILI|nr:homeobox protein HOX1A [Canna indica]